VANWRRKALALFPDLRLDLEQPNFSIYMVFFELLPRVREAHADGDMETLRRIYGFAEWCFEQKAKDMWNAAGVAFYEHLFDSHPSHWSEMVRWLSPKIVTDCWGLWESRLSSEDLKRVRQLLDDCRKPLYHDARLTSD
jgi:hypothetical protein